MDGSEEMLSGTFVGRYTVERELGRGATATVYLARDTQQDRAVAIKVLRPELAASVGADRFLREIAVNESLKHPHIAPVLDSGEHDGLLFFVLPHMEGGSLRHLLRREKQLSVESAITIARSMADALDYAHGKGLIHRDVKPENILFSAGRACLADFGIARAIERTIDESTTSTGLVRGTPAYMSPEQAGGGRDYDGRSDQFSLACVLYEMLAGMPAFIGPTPEAIIAQRFQHAPRKLHVYRASISPGLEGVIERALSLTPADRFATMAAFGDALRDAPRQPTVESATPAKVTRPGVRRWTSVGAGALVLAAAIYWGAKQAAAKSAVADTTAYVILPVDSTVGIPSSELFELMHQGFARWNGITVRDRFATREALPPTPLARSDAEVTRAVKALSAGRYVRTEVRRTGDTLRAYATLHEIGRPSLSEASVDLPVDLRGGAEAINRLALGLLLGGDTVTASSTSLPAVWLYAAGWSALRQLDFARADSLFAKAVEQDASFGQASLWLAQVRAWRRQRPALWQALVERASAGEGLTAREQRLSQALLALAHQQFDAACRAYEALRNADPRDFVAWIGLGDCRRRDGVVIRDLRSPSGYRFRSNHVEAARNYGHGFEIAPGIAGDVAIGAYAQLQQLLFADRSRVLRGAALPPDTTAFLGYATWLGDSVAFTPYPEWMITRGMPTATTAARLRALTIQRAAFLRIARSWSALLPSSAGAKEAVAVALEMSGEPSALDTMRLARRLARPGNQQLRLAVEEVLLGAALGRRDPRRLQAVVALGDSLLAGAERSTADAAMMLAPVAALLGKCRLASALQARGTGPLVAVSAGVPLFVYAAKESLMVRSVLGCAVEADAREEQRLVDAALGASDKPDSRSRDQIEYDLLWQSVRLSRRDTGQLVRLARVSGNYHLRIQLLAMRGAADSVRSIILDQRRRRGDIGAAEYSFDGALAEARALLAIHDSSSAMLGLDPVLTRTGWLDQLWGEPIQAATMVHAAALRAKLAQASGDQDIAHRWASYVGTLWRHADKELVSTTAKMNAILASTRAAP